MSKTLITSRDPKGLHIISLFEVALNKAGLNERQAQHLIENGGRLQESFRESLEKHSVANQLTDEEVRSDYGYLSGYKPKSITEQTNRLRELFPGIGYADEEISSQSLPSDAEGWFAIPRWQKVAETYSEAVKRVLDLINKTRNGKFHNYHDSQSQIDAQHLRQSQKTVEIFRTIGKKQKDYDILIVPCQFGKRHAGRSVRRAHEAMLAFEFGLDAFSVGIMLLTHPERLQHYNDLWIDCAGDKFSDNGDGHFEFAPCFFFVDDGINFGAGSLAGACGYYGSVSGFSPQ